MLIKGYKDYKKDVLGIYDEFKKSFDFIERKVPDNIDKVAKKIEEEIFNLMVLGEAKSGKSTFINAYIGEEILPMHVLQCTSAIIKIHSGENPKFIAKSASGATSEQEGIEAIQKFLTDHARIDEKYRTIPVTTINNDFIIRYKGEIKEDELNKLIENLQKDNIYKIEEKEYNNLIRTYIKDNAKNWIKIPVEIDIEYPLPEYMQGITIIDSPGVNAGGNVGEVTEKYLDNADAIIFVKSINGQALESESFMNFLRKHCSEKKKESLFLVLTGKSNLTGDDLESVKEQAVKLYEKDIKEEKIIEVDSKIQLFLNRCLKFDTPKEITNYFKELKKTNNKFSPASECWYDSDNDINTFEENMKEESNFPKVEEMLDHFARTANFLQLVSFLDNIEREYRALNGRYTEVINTIKDKIGDPVALENAINEKKKEIDEIVVKINKGVRKIVNKYTDPVKDIGIIPKEAKTKSQEYESKIEEFLEIPKNQIDDSIFSKMKKMAMDINDDAEKFQNEMTTRIVEECNKELIKCIDDPNSMLSDAITPNITEEEFDEINNNAEKESTKTKTFKLFWLIPLWSWQEHDLKEHVKKIVDEIKGKTKDITSIIQTQLLERAIKCTTIYQSKLTDNANNLQSEYDKLLEEKDEKEKLQKRLENLKEKLNHIEKELSNITPLKEELDVRTK